MSVIYQDENKRSGSGGTDSVDSVICIRRIGRCMKRKHFGRSRERTIGI